MSAHGRCFAISLAGLVVLSLAGTAWSADNIRSQANHYCLAVPDGWVEMPSSAIQQFTRTVLPDGKVRYETGLQLRGAEPFTYPYVLVQVVPLPRTPGVADMKSMIQQMTGMRPADLKDLSPKLDQFIDRSSASFSGVGFDEASHSYQLTMRMNVKDFGRIQGMSVGHFGSSALVVVHAYAAEADFGKLAPTFSQIARSLRFDPEAAWREPPGFDWNGVAGRTVSGAIIGAIVGALVYVFKKKSGTGSTAS